MSMDSYFRSKTRLKRARASIAAVEAKLALLKAARLDGRSHEPRETKMTEGGQG